jgi:hypothetical protein
VKIKEAETTVHLLVVRKGIEKGTPETKKSRHLRVLIPPHEAEN